MTGLSGTVGGGRFCLGYRSLVTDYTRLSLSDPLPLILFTLAEVTCRLP